MDNAVITVTKFIHQLNEAKIYHTVRCTRNDAISIDVSVPGQRWEIDFLSDGTIDIEIFKSDGNIYDSSKLSELFKNFSQ